MSMPFLVPLTAQEWPCMQMPARVSRVEYALEHLFSCLEMSDL